MEKALIRLNVINRDGQKNIINVKEGTTIRDAIEEKLSPNNYGVCGGACCCGTCHVYVASEDFKKLNAKEEDEVEMLETMATKPATHSRLGCQVELKKEYNNITVTIAPED